MTAPEHLFDSMSDLDYTIRAGVCGLMQGVIASVRHAGCSRARRVWVSGTPRRSLLLWNTRTWRPFSAVLPRPPATVRRPFAVGRARGPGTPVKSPGSVRSTAARRRGCFGVRPVLIRLYAGHAGLLRTGRECAERLAFRRGDRWGSAWRRDGGRATRPSASIQPRRPPRCLPSRSISARSERACGGWMWDLAKDAKKKTSLLSSSGYYFVEFCPSPLGIALTPQGSARHVQLPRSKNSAPSRQP